MEEEFSLSFLLSESSTMRYTCKFCSSNYANTIQLVSHQNSVHLNELSGGRRLGIHNVTQSNKRKRENMDAIPSTSKKSHKSGSQSSFNKSDPSSSYTLKDEDNEEYEDICDNYLFDQQHGIGGDKMKQEEEMDDDDDQDEDLDIQMENYIQCEFCHEKFTSVENLESHLSLECPVKKSQQIKQESQLVSPPTPSTMQESDITLISKPVKKGNDQVENPVEFEATAATKIYEHHHPIASSSSKFPKIKPQTSSPVSILTIDPTKIPAPLMYRLLPKNFADSLIESLF